MISVEIEYRPFTFIPWTRRIEKKLPSRWSEMNAAQIASIPDLQLGQISDVKLLQLFVGLKKSIAKRIDSYQAYCITRNLKYISRPEPLNYFVIKKIGGFKAPEKNLKGVTFGAFVFGDTYYQNYINGKREDINRFIACFYTDSRGFDDKLIDLHADILKGSKVGTREAIAINYGLIREWLALAYPYVFQKGEPNSAKSKGWVDVFDMIVANDLGNQDKYSQLPVSTVLRYLNNKTKDFYKYGSKV